MRFFVAILCLFAVAACPYECAVKRVIASCSQEPVRMECCDGCCSEPPSDPNEHGAPSPPAPEEDGIWCVCEGVIYDSSARTLVDDVTLTSFLPPADPVLAAVEIKRPNRVERASESSPDILDSKSLRIGLRSLQL